MANFVQNYNGGVQFKTGASQGLTVDINGALGVGITPSVWTDNYKAIDLAGNGGIASTTGGYLQLANNAYVNSGVWKYKATGYATLIQQTPSGAMQFQVTASGVVNTNITWNNTVTIDSTGNLLLTSGTGALGYGTGAGGTVTQLTSKSTAVTSLPKPSGQIIMNGAALAAGASVSFVLNNSLIATNDLVYTTITGGVTTATNYRVEAVNTASGISNIRLTNLSAGSLSEAVQIQFVVIRGVIA